METSNRDELIGQRLGNYLIERLLGVGGMARVYQARDVLLQREVAVKALAPAFLVDADYVERFRREAQSVAALDDPHIVPVLQFIEHDRGLFLVMPLFLESLRERLERTKRLELGEATRIIRDIGAALAAAHAHGLIHRDVKPGNILLDERGAAALCDFGLAREATVKGNSTAPTLAGSGLPVGTPQYMAPEQLRGEELDQRADIYGLGVVVYEMLTGRTPHDGNSPFEVAAAALNGSIIPPSTLNPAITPAVEAVILRALSMRPDDRYANVTSLVEALDSAEQEPAVEIAPFLASPAPVEGRALWQFQPAAMLRGRTRAWWISLSVITLAVMLGLGGGGVLLASLRGQHGPDGPTLSIDRVNHPATATQTSQTGASTTTPGVGGTATPGGATPTGTLTATPSATANATPTATATAKPTATAAATPTATPAPLAISALHLTHGSGNRCAGLQTITNNSAQTLGWRWDAIVPDPPSSFLFGVNAPVQFGGLPGDLSPGIAPGQHDTLNVQMKCTGIAQSYTVTFSDTLGRTRTFAMTSDA